MRTLNAAERPTISVAAGEVVSWFSPLLDFIASPSRVWTRRVTGDASASVFVVSGTAPTLVVRLYTIVAGLYVVQNEAQGPAARIVFDSEDITAAGMLARFELTGGVAPGVVTVPWSWSAAATLLHAP